MTANKLDVIAKANARLQESKAEPFSSLAISINGTPVVPNNPDTVLPDTPVRVCQTSDLPVLHSRCVLVHDRQVILFHRANGWFAMDGICYHMGGPLVKGSVVDIEEPMHFRRAAEILGVVGPKSGREVVVCPWHAYRITLDTGEGMTMDTNSHWKSKGPRQRTHKVTVKDGEVFVTLTSGKFLPSDEYCNRKDIRIEEDTT